MTTMISLASTASPIPPAIASGPRQAASGAPPHDFHDRMQRLARLTGLLFIITFATSIPPFVYFYAQALDDPAFILKGGFVRSLAIGALLELVLIIANIGTALTLYPELKKRSDVLALGYVTARLTECGIIALMALSTMRMNSSTTDQAMLVVTGQALIAIHDWTFRLGPGVVVGLGNGLILGYLMWKTRLVPRAMSILGLIGGPALRIAGVAVVLGYE